MSERSIDALRASVLARFEMLQGALSGNKDVPKSFRDACMSQSTFAALALPSRGIDGHALNTLKAASDALIEQGGWKRLDAMRRKCRHSEKVAKKRMRGAKGERPTEASSLEIERRFRLRLEVAYFELLKKIAQLGKADPDVDTFLRRHKAGFSLERVKLVVGGRSEG